jgi:cell division septation protein DedD
MPHLPNPSRGASRLRRAIVPTIAMATLALLGGCSLWPKALSFQSDPLPTQAEPTPATAAPASSGAPASAPMSAVTPTSVHAPTAMPVEPKPEVTSSAVAAPAKVEAAPLRAIQPAPAAAPAPQAAAAPQVAAPPRTVPASGLVHGFYINAGLFAVSSNGRNAYKILEDAGLPVFSDVVKTKKRTLTRVRVGPYATRAQADAAATKIHGLKLAAIVFKH